MTLDTYEYKITLKVADVDEEFWFDSECPNLTKQEIVENMIVRKRKKPINKTNPTSDAESLDFLKSMFGFK